MKSDDYWRDHYNDDSIVNTGDPQRNVGRTRGGEAITNDGWERALTYIRSYVGPIEDRVVLELCCGNGMVIGNLAAHCRKAVGVDYSEALLSQLEELFPDKVETILADVMELELSPNLYDVIIIHFSIQHFEHADAIRLVEKSYNALAPSGKLFIGDIPSELLKWDYISRPEYRKDYIQRLLDNRPMIGSWFHPEFFVAIGCHVGCEQVEILEQPGYLINSSHRFDVLFTKQA
jgi:SAM-dependent methyltransferase